jgi:hypothetical protein
LELKIKEEINMKCEHCGKEMIKVGILTEQEQNDWVYTNEKFNCASMALNNDVIKDIEFTDGQVFEYFKASYDQLAQANYLRFVFDRNLRKRLGVPNIDGNIIIDSTTWEVFQHPNEEHEEENK